MDTENIGILKQHIEELQAQLVQTQQFIGQIHNHLLTPIPNITAPYYYYEFYNTQSVMVSHAFSEKVEVHVYITDSSGNYTPATGHTFTTQWGSVIITLDFPTDGYVVVRNADLGQVPMTPPIYNMPGVASYVPQTVDLLQAPLIPNVIVNPTPDKTISSDIDIFDDAMTVLS